MNRWGVLCVLAAAMLAGCMMRHDVQNYTAIDQAQKTVTVEPGSYGFKGEVKKILAKHGWKMAIDRGPVKTKGAGGDKINTETSGTFTTRYRLYISFRHWGDCLDFTPAINYELSMVDNQTGTEVFSISGSGCQGTALEKFEQAITGIPDK